MFNLKSYARDVRGNFSVMFAGALGLILIGSTSAIEVGNMIRVKSDLQAQLDIATLLAAATEDNDRYNDPNYAKIVKDTMLDNGFSEDTSDPTATVENGYLNTTITTPYKGLLYSSILNEKRDLTVKAQATLPGVGAIELALVLDNTGSMGVGGRIGALKIGAGSIIDAVRDGGSGSKIALIPFARYTNIGADNDGTWLVKPTEYDTERTWQQATHDNGTCYYETRTKTKDGAEYSYEEEVCPDRTTTYEERSKTIESRYKGCVGTSEEPYHLNDISASNKVIGLLNNIPKERTGMYYDVEAYCPLNITGFSNDYREVKNQANRMYPTDVTNIATGLLWGDRVMKGSVAFPRDAPLAEDTQQVMILMSDGDNTAQIEDAQSFRDNYQAPPYMFHVPPSEVTPKANADTLTMCNRIKGRDIIIYTISFQVKNDLTKQLLEDCATSPSHAYKAEDNNALIDTFGTIAGKLKQQVRLSK